MSEKDPGVLDPHWEDALRAGQAADGAEGSVEAELAVVHLFRHAAGPETLEPDALEAVWSETAEGIEAESGFVPWWRRMLDWRVGVGVGVAAAAAAVLLMATRPPSPDPGAGAGAPIAQAGGAAGMSVTLEGQFELLAPEARADIAHRVDGGRGAVRARMVSSLAPTAPKGEQR